MQSKSMNREEPSGETGLGCSPRHEPNAGKIARENFEVADSIIISDPCHDPGDRGTVIYPAKPGRWRGRVDVAPDDFAPNVLRVARLEASHEGGESGRWEDVPGAIGVDSGQAGVFAVECFQGDDRAEGGLFPDLDTFYGRCCTTTMARGWGMTEDGVVSSSGYGDGTYPAQVRRDAEGQVVGVRVSFGFHSWVPGGGLMRRIPIR